MLNGLSGVHHFGISLTHTFYSKKLLHLRTFFQETEDFLSNLVVNKTVLAKTDRPAGVVSFSQRKDPNDVLNEWSNHLSSLMQLVNKTTHLINKEEMVHKHLLPCRD